VTRVKWRALAALTAGLLLVGGCGSKPSGASPGDTSGSPGFQTGAAQGRIPPRYYFPVNGQASYGRTHHDYPATDIISPCGTEVVAVTDGIVLETSTVDTWDPKVNTGDTRGGLSISILGDDGVRYYGSHFRKIEAGVTAGARVRAGQKIGEVGQTGDARLSVCHLHFGISPMCNGVGDWWTRRGAVWPWPYLDAWRGGQDTSPVSEIKAWQDGHGCPPSPDHPGGSG